MKRNTKLFDAARTAMVLTIAGCSGQSSTETSEESIQGTLAELTLAEGQVVTFHALDGALIVREIGDKGQSPVISRLLEQNLSLVELYEALDPNGDMPDALHDALDRAALGQGVALTPPASSAESVVQDASQMDPRGVASRAITSSTFLANGGCNVGQSSVFSVCRTNRVNSYWAHANSRSSLLNVASGTGSFVARLTMGGSPYDTAVAHNKQVTIFSTMDNGAIVQHRLDILNAAGDTFHVGGYWYN